MTGDQIFNLAMLQRHYWPPDFIQHYYGLDFEGDEGLKNEFGRWMKSLKTNVVPIFKEDTIHRCAIETFMQQRKVKPFRHAALSLGMDESSLRCIWKALQERGDIIDNIRDFSEDIFYESWLTMFHDFFAVLCGVVFSNQSRFCAALHKAVEKELGIQVNPQYCVTSKKLGENPPDFSHEPDSISLEPIGLRYQIWLDFHKPLNLKPDSCSSLLYFKELETLKDFVFPGSEARLTPDIIEKLRLEK